MAENGDRPQIRLVAHCRRCNGWLVSAPSVQAGIGPQCAKREADERRAATASRLTELTLFDVAA